LSRGAVSTYAEWTAADDATLREAYSTGGILAAREALPARGPSAIYHRAQRLKVVRRRRWTAQDDTRLRLLWDGGNTVEEVAESLGRTVITTYWRAQVLGLPLGVPDGWESISDAAKRTGYGTGQLRRILRHSGVTIRRALSAPGRPKRGKGKSKKKIRLRYIVFPGEVDVAMDTWHATEPAEAAAARLGISGETLRRRLVLAGVKRRRPPGPPTRHHWRVTAEEVAKAMAYQHPKKVRSRGYHGYFADEQTQREAA
jgi:hypothetical protein